MLAVAPRKKGARPKKPEHRRTENIGIPLTPEERRVIERAAELEGTGIAMFARGVLLPVARRIVAQHEAE